MVQWQQTLLSTVRGLWTSRREPNVPNDAVVDVLGTIDILEAQLKRTDLPKKISEIDEYTQGDNKRVDIAGKLCNINGKICWSFGKHKNNPVKDTPSYVNWYLEQSVPSETEKIIREIIKK